MNDDRVFSLLVKVSADVLNISKDLNEFKESTELRFAAIDDRFKAMDERFDAIDKRLDTMEKRLDGRIDEVIDQLEEIEAKNIDRHSEMQKLINQNTSDISKLKRVE